MKNQSAFTQKALFEHYLVSNPWEEYVHCQIPFYMDTAFYNQAVYDAESVHQIAFKILNTLGTVHHDLTALIEDFPLKERILNLKCPLTPIFWTRFDTFRENETNQVLFAEFNYDKPCAQKEIGLAGNMSVTNNVNKNFENVFLSKLTDISKAFNPNKTHYNIAVLVDPCHYEELYLSYYFKKLCLETNLNIIQVGPKNLSVKNDTVYAFGTIPIDIILRLYPTEYLHEVNDIEAILQLFEKAKVWIVNDPRVIVIQMKIFFAYLWKLVEDDDKRLKDAEKEIIKRCIPKTKPFHKADYNMLLENKDDYVVKPSFGRYSEQVCIGKLYTNEAWQAQLDAIMLEKKTFIIQHRIDIRQDYTYKVEAFDMTRPCKGYGNFGTYMICGKVAGMCVRWSEDLLTLNETTWMCPIGIKNYPIAVMPYTGKNRKQLWDKVNERSIFEYGFTGGYYKSDEYISMDRLVITEALYHEMTLASSMFCKILSKTAALVTKNFEWFGPILGIHKKLWKCILNSKTNQLCAIGRIDFVIDQEGNLKILEFNAETPAGIVESIGLNKIIKEEQGISELNPNTQLASKIETLFKQIINDFEKEKPIKHIAFLTCNYYEDLFTTYALADIAKRLKGYKVSVGNIYDITVQNEKLYLYGEEIDAIYRHYPLDWLADEPDLWDCIEILNQQVFVINPTHTLITQSKAFFAVIESLVGKAFYNDKEEHFIRKYLPYTSLEPDNEMSHDCIAKPYFSREGKGIEMSFDGIQQSLTNLVFQERVNIAPISIKRYTTFGEKQYLQFPVIGMYIVGEEPTGIFTRIGEFVTNASANFIPTYVQINKK